MDVVKIDRRAANHGDYYGEVRLTYDEVVLISGALYHAQKDPSAGRRDEKAALWQKFGAFHDMLCYGRICRDRGGEKQREEVEA